jgi:hypothetical protein
MSRLGGLASTICRASSLELGDDAGEMRPHGRSRQKSWLEMRSNQEAGARVHHDYILYDLSILPILEGKLHSNGVVGSEVSFRCVNMQQIAKCHNRTV